MSDVTFEPEPDQPPVELVVHWGFDHGTVTWETPERPEQDTPPSDDAPG
jgi:hypothetical protein